MRLLIISEAVHKVNAKGEAGSYAPYVREINLWVRQVDEVVIIAPVVKGEFTPIEIKIEHPNLQFRPVAFPNFTTLKYAGKSFFHMPGIMALMIKEMRKADHIHVRCPASLGLYASLIQVLFPRKKKTAKYAGNWDWESKQPESYRMQQKLLRNTTLTKNMQALVYGDWPDRTKNIRPFFTATYHASEWEPQEARELSANQPIYLIYVGTMSSNKRPLVSAAVCRELRHKGYDAQLDMYGAGPEMNAVNEYIRDNNLTAFIKTHGNQKAEVVKQAYRRSHFLIFLSKSEGWPKVVAESMGWGCVPITSKVSCVPQMLNNGERGKLVKPEIDAVVKAVETYIDNPAAYKETARKAMEWSRQYTLEKFETEIKTLL